MKKVVIILVSIFFVASCSYIFNTSPSDKEVVSQVKETLEKSLNDGLFRIERVEKVSGFKRNESYIAVIEYSMVNECDLSEMKRISRDAKLTRDYKKVAKIYILEERYGRFNAGDIEHKWRIEVEFIKSEKGWVVNSFNPSKMLQLK